MIEYRTERNVECVKVWCVWTVIVYVCVCTMCMYVCVRVKDSHNVYYYEEKGYRIMKKTNHKLRPNQSVVYCIVLSLQISCSREEGKGMYV